MPPDVRDRFVTMLRRQKLFTWTVAFSIPVISVLLAGPVDWFSLRSIQITLFPLFGLVGHWWLASRFGDALDGGSGRAIVETRRRWPGGSRVFVDGWIVGDAVVGRLSATESWICWGARGALIAHPDHRGFFGVVLSGARRA